MSDFVIDVSSPEEQFKRHLGLKNNRRIVFSGAFGLGKTWFLNHYFFKKFKDEYFSIRLAPVNYSVSSNEDIFELIKFDILFELLKEGTLPSEIEPSKEFLLQHLYLLDPEKGINGLLEKADKTGHDFLLIKGKLEKLLGGGSPRPPASPNNVDAYLELRQFLEKYCTERGGVYERNTLSKLLFYLISEQEKETVLIIDDLDRIDPEHIFRILNVFAAQFDIDPSDENKFGFNKIIVVCDLDNIRKIFANRYGQSTDFSGYIDKFFSHSVFTFENSAAVLDRIDEVFSELNPADDHTKNILPLNNGPHFGRELVSYIFRAFLRLNLLSLRSICKIYERKHYAIEAKAIYLPTGRYSAYQFLALTALLFVRDVVGSFDALHTKLQACVDKKIGIIPLHDGDRDRDHKYKLASILPILNSEKLADGPVMVYESPYHNAIFNFEIATNNEIFIAYNIKIHHKSDETKEYYVRDIFPYLLEAANKLNEIGALT